MASNDTAVASVAQASGPDLESAGPANSLNITSTSGYTSYFPIAFKNHDTSLVAYFPFSGNANDLSQYGNHGVVNGASLTTGRSGNPNSAYSFDGTDDFILVSDPGGDRDLDGFSQLTILAWVRPDDVQGEGIVTKYDSRLPSGVAYFFFIGEGNLWIGIQQSVTPVSEALLRSTSEIAVTGDFIHVAGVWKGGASFELYINGEQQPGVLEVAGPVPATMANNAVPVSIGRFHSSSGSIEGPFHYFDGVIDEVKIYDRALTPSEIRTAFEASGAEKR
jgi:hypothetical protein